MHRGLLETVSETFPLGHRPTHAAALVEAELHGEDRAKGGRLGAVSDTGCGARRGGALTHSFRGGRRARGAGRCARNEAERRLVLNVGRGGRTSTVHAEFHNLPRELRDRGELDGRLLSRGGWNAW